MARNEQQNERMREERSRNIMRAATKLFATRGFGATRIADIADEAGMSHGLMYHYFKSKDEIFTAIVSDAFDKLCQAALKLERSELPPHDKLKLATTQILNDLERGVDFAWRSTLISLASISDSVPDGVRTIISAKRDIPYRAVASIAGAGQRAGTVRTGNPDEMALAFWAAVKGLALHKAALGKKYKSPAPDVLVGIFFDGAGDE